MAISYRISWLQAKRVILIQYNGDVSQDEIRQLNTELEKFFAEGETPIHIISDNSKMGKINLTIPLVQETFSAMKQAGWGWVFVIGLNPVIRFFAEIFGTKFKLNVRSANNIDEAYQALKKLDTTLPDLAIKNESP